MFISLLFLTILTQLYSLHKLLKVSENIILPNLPKNKEINTKGINKLKMWIIPTRGVHCWKQNS